jgi:recombination protein RecA
MDVLAKVRMRGLIAGIQSARAIASAGSEAEPIAAPRLAPEELAGRMIEVSGCGATAVLSVAAQMVVDAQLEGEPTAWVTGTGSSFFPPDLAAAGVDLGALVVTRAPDPRSIRRMTDQLLRAGAFGLIVVDLGPTAELSLADQSRLAGLAKKHDTALVCLTQKKPETPSLGSLVSLRIHAIRRRSGDGAFVCDVKVLKDKRRGPTWEHAEVRRATPGLR